MKCPLCGAADTRVVDSRASQDGFAIRRRRHCDGCGNRFTTLEQVGEPIMVLKKDCSRVPFDRGKIRAGIEKACCKRPIPTEMLSAMTERVVARISQLKETEVTTEQIGVLVMEQLRGLDPVAYLRFASVCRGFNNANDFEQEIRPLLEQPASK